MGDLLVTRRPVTATVASLSTSTSRDESSVTGPGIVTRAASLPPPPLPTKTLFWECDSNLLDGSVVTGIVSATNLLGPWQVETQFDLVTVSNQWTDTNLGTIKFWRAFNDWK